MRTIQIVTLVTFVSTAEAFIPATPSKFSHHEITHWKARSLSGPLHVYQNNQENDLFDPMNLSYDVHQSALQPETARSGELSVWAARGLLLAVAVLWGTNFASVKYLENLCFHPPCHHLPSEAALARFGVAAAASTPFLINQRKDVILAGLECGLFISLGYFTQALALSTISAGECAFICSLTVVVVPLLSALFFGKPVKPINLVSGLLAIVGVGVLEGVVDFHQAFNIQPAVAETIESSLPVLASTSSTAAESTGWLANLEVAGLTKGDLMALGQPFGFGIAFMRIEHYVEKFKEVPNRIMTLSAAQCMAVGLLSMFWVMYDFNGHIPNLEYMIEPHRLGAIAWTGIMTTVVAIYLEGFALQVVSATEAALTFASEPVWASLFGAWLLHERLNINSYVGGSIILGACILSAFDSNDEDTKEE
eukprot:CAMPEP_0204637104 /NCGR_PEP_ID=MMETSP0717-20131115/35608_1 /ASSEMBLY_ACC=CAM_ASM_000666 /TAXON_ID=230516 /ORGANISM="Chaetoceros curvisetus" /LENGTH=422 /DNA_ID=CAMNT_0051656385 /DNA_START=708 /DNA_END=1976 /DNA_ORIENTATION=-